MVLVERYGISTDPRMGGSGINNREATNGPGFVVRNRSDAGVYSVIAIPVIKLLQVGIMGAQVLDVNVRAKNYAECLHEGGESRATMRRRQKQDGTGLAEDRKC
jgi:hypothetical protein